MKEESYAKKWIMKQLYENDSLTILAQQLSATNIFKNTEIYIDEFVGFTKQEYDIIAKLLQVANSVVITVSSDLMYKDKEASSDIFYSYKDNYAL